MHLPVGNPALFTLYKRIWRIECGNRKTSRVLQNKTKTGVLGLNPEYTSFSFLNHYPKYILKKENCVRIAFVCLSHMKKIFSAFRRRELNPCSSAERILWKFSLNSKLITAVQLFSEQMNICLVQYPSHISLSHLPLHNFSILFLLHLKYLTQYI